MCKKSKQISIDKSISQFQVFTLDFAHTENHFYVEIKIRFIILNEYKKIFSKLIIINFK